MNENKTNINWYPGHMAKTKRELKEKIDLIDIIYEVIDARMPISSLLLDVDDIIKNKPRIIIVSKYDLCDSKETDKLLSKYNDCSIVKMDIINGSMNDLINETKKIVNTINEKRKEKNLMPRKGRVAVIGSPNVGKSTLINRLAGRKVNLTGDTPGVTKNLSWTRIANDIELLDSPGILWPKLEDENTAYTLAAFSSIKDTIVDKYDLTNFIINKMNTLYPNNLKERYSLGDIDMDTIYDDIALKRGYLSKGKVINYDQVCDAIINDLRNGKLGNVTFDR